jgi:hypothetical protein
VPPTIVLQPSTTSPLGRPALPPAPVPRPRTGRGLRGVAVVAAVVLAVIVITIVSNQDRPTASRPVPVVDTPRNNVPATPTYNPTTTTIATPSSPLSAQDELARQAAADRAEVESLAGRWVPQLSSKKPGLVANGTTYDYVEILDEFRSLKARYPAARLLWSGDFTSFKFADFWVTVDAFPASDAAAANSWCDSQAIGPDDCFAKLISHSIPYEGATVHRPK